MKFKIDTLIGALKEKYHVPSVQAAICIKGETIYCGKGLANMELEKAAAPDSIYAIGSATKSFTAMAVGILVDEGKLDFDTPIRQYIPDFEMVDPYSTENLTLRDALSHRSGLPRHDLIWRDYDNMTTGDMVKMFKFLPPSAPIRYRWQYQNSMFVLAGHIIAAVTGLNWYEFIKERILVPLEMNDTYFNPQDFAHLPQATRPYAWNGEKIVPEKFINLYPIGASGCIHSTVRDLNKWAQFQLTAGEWNGKQIISRQTMAQLHTPQMLIGEKDALIRGFSEIKFQTYGLGWFIESYRGHKLVHHAGGVPGYRSLVAFLPDDNISFCILTNSVTHQAVSTLQYAIPDITLGLSELDWVSNLFDFVTKYRADQAQLVHREKSRIDENADLSDRFEQFCGRYIHPAYGDIIISVEAGKLKALLDDMSFELKCAKDGGFIAVLEGDAAASSARFDFAKPGQADTFSIKLEPNYDGLIKFEREDKQHA